MELGAEVRARSSVLRGPGMPGWVGALMLAGLWLGPLPELAARSFSAHMVLHMGVVAVASPLLALGIAGGTWDPVRRWPAVFSPAPAAAFELLVVWGWHAPGMHEAARGGGAILAAEQASFLVAGSAMWLSALGGGLSTREASAGAGAVGLLLTSMHMTLLGALLGLTPRPLYEHAGPNPLGLTPLEDVHLGGAIMLGFGGAVYLAGGLFLVARLLRIGSRDAP